MSRWCLDTWAVLRWLEGAEPAASRVQRALEERPVMSWINVGEVAYVTERAAGAATASAIVRDLEAMLELDAATPSRVLEAASVKARHPMAFADAFAVATAMAHEAVLPTGDPEILGATGPWMAEDLRAGSEPRPAGARAAGSRRRVAPPRVAPPRVAPPRRGRGKGRCAVGVRSRLSVLRQVKAVQRVVHVGGLRLSSLAMPEDRGPCRSPGCRDPGVASAIDPSHDRAGARRA